MRVTVHQRNVTQIALGACEIQLWPATPAPPVRAIVAGGVTLATDAARIIDPAAHSIQIERHRLRGSRHRRGWSARQSPTSPTPSAVTSTEMAPPLPVMCSSAPFGEVAVDHRARAESGNGYATGGKITSCGRTASTKPCVDEVLLPWCPRQQQSAPQLVGRIGQQALFPWALRYRQGAARHGPPTADAQHAAAVVAPPAIRLGVPGARRYSLSGGAVGGWD